MANCHYLQRLIDAVQIRALDVGVYSSPRIWNLFFGGTSACTNASAHGIPVWCVDRLQMETVPLCFACLNAFLLRCNASLVLQVRAVQ